MKWRIVSSKGEPARWSKPCALVQMYVQDHPGELVHSMRYTWEVVINGAAAWNGWTSSARAAKFKAVTAARQALSQALTHIAGYRIEIVRYRR